VEPNDLVSAQKILRVLERSESLRVLPVGLRSARKRENEEGRAMWISLFSIVAAIAVALSVAAIVVESYNDAHGKRARL